MVTGQQAREHVERERRKEAHRVGEAQSSLSQSTSRIGEWYVLEIFSHFILSHFLS